MGFGGGWEEQAVVFLCGTFVLRKYGMPRYGVARKRSAAAVRGREFWFCGRDFLLLECDFWARTDGFLHGWRRMERQRNHGTSAGD